MALSSKHIFGLCILSCISSKMYSNLCGTYFLALISAGLGNRVYRKLYTLIGGQRAENFENHWSRLICEAK